jgi:hypothetical protein
MAAEDLLDCRLVVLVLFLSGVQDQPVCTQFAEVAHGV